MMRRDRTSFSSLRTSSFSQGSSQGMNEAQYFGPRLAKSIAALNALHGALDRAIAEESSRVRLPQGGGISSFTSSHSSSAMPVSQLLQGQEPSNMLASASANGYSSTTSAAAFLDSFEAELGRATQTMESQMTEQENAAKALLRSCIDGTTKDDRESVRYLNMRVQEIVSTCLKLQRFCIRNASVFKDVAARADAELKGSTCTNLLLRRLNQSPWNDGQITAIVAILSDLRVTIRRLEAAQRKKEASFIDDLASMSSEWIAPSKFERKTTKFWVQPDQLTPLLLACVAEVPILVYGQSSGYLSRCRGTSGAPTRVSVSDTRATWDSLSAPISSVYFDSPETMCLYKERIRRSHGAQLFRIRWYGHRRPKGNEIVFLELKTHHENWASGGEQSMKERVHLQEKNVDRFLSATSAWTDDVARAMIQGAQPALKLDKLEAQVALLHKMRQLIVGKKLRPCVRSAYNRIAFQSPDSNALRLTLDRNVTLIDESQTPKGSWCLPDDAVVSNEVVRHVPYLVFEFKVDGTLDIPRDLQSLIDGNNILIEANKFSKYLTGAAAFSADRVPGGLDLPYWAGEEAFRDVFCKKESGEDSAGVEVSAEVSAVDRATRPPQGSDETSDRIVVVNSCDPTPTTSESSQEGLGSRSKTSLGGSRGSSLFRRRPPTSAQLTTSTTTFRSSLASRFSIAGPNKDQQPSKTELDQKVLPRKRARVEPKSYFANERTMIQWISAALLLVTISVILLDFSTGNNVPSAAGILLNVCAIFIVAYAMFTYYRRLKLLQSASPYGYVDIYGPVILGVAVLLGVTTLLYYYIFHAVTAPRSEAASARESVLSPALGTCYQRPTNSMSSLEYQPSGVVVDKERSLLLVPSLDRITALSLGEPDSPIQTLITIPGADLEALTYADNRIFALGEGEDNPLLYELKWNFAFDAMYLLQQWTLETSNHGDSSGSAEGLAFIPDESSPAGGSLYVAGDHYDSAAPQERAVVYIYDLPPVSSEIFTPQLKRKGILNSNMLTLDLIEADDTQSDSKIGDLHYNSGVLYVVHDNAQVIRAWNTTSGELLGATRLPQVARKSSRRQWEGMALERIEGDAVNPSLRGAVGAPAPLVLHLALDTPPQVWSFAVTEDEQGSIALPPCAAAS